MFLSTLRVLKFSLQDIIRNIWLSLVIIIILTLALFTVNLLATVKVIGDAAINAVKDKIDVNVFLANDAAEDSILALKTRIENLPPVKEVDYITKEEALKQFQEKHQDSPEILDALKELNANPLSPTLVIKPKDLTSMDDLINRLNALDDTIIESRNFTDYKTMLDKINSITDKISEIGVLISTIFIIITILVVYNSVRVAIYTHRREITIMRLVGASHWFINLPFIISGIIYTIISMLVILAVYMSFLSILQPYLETFFVGYSINIAEYFRNNFLMIFGLEFLGAALINIIASLSALRVYSKI